MTIEEFEWDDGNKEKNWKKHQVSMKECEQVFLDVPFLIFKDTNHCDREDRYIALGKTGMRRLLHVVFTIRAGHVRIISARDQNKKERSRYEKEKN